MPSQSRIVDYTAIVTLSALPLVSDAAIMADIPGHRRGVRPVLKSQGFCSTSHASAVTPPLNKNKFLRGFSAYDEWQKSAASRETVALFYKRETSADYRTCHMPRTHAPRAVAANNGSIASHRWLGAKAITPRFYDQAKQAELTEKFLRDQVLTVDVFALRHEATGTMVAPLSAENSIALASGERVTADEVVFNRKAAHVFPQNKSARADKLRASLKQPHSSTAL